MRSEEFPRALLFLPSGEVHSLKEKENGTEINV
jgi:hypothetical protein